MLSLANGKTLISAAVHLPRAGVWHAELAVDTQSPADVAGAVAISLTDDALLLEGSSVGVPALWRGLTRVRVAAGAAGLGAVLEPQGYYAAPVRTIVADILGPAGETLSPASSADLLATILPSWTRLAQSAGTALTVLAAKLGATWRALPDGTIWFGTEAWASSLVTDYHVLRSSPIDRRIEIGTSTASLLPGTTFEGGNVGRVVHHIDADAIRTEAFFE